MAKKILNLEEIESLADEIKKRSQWYLDVGEVSKLKDPQVEVILRRCFEKAGTDVASLCDMVRSLTTVVRAIDIKTSKRS